MPKNTDKKQSKPHHSVVLGGERSGHIEKKYNELNSREFFGYLYRNSMGKLMITNFLLLLLVSPILILSLVFNTYSSMSFNANLPIDETFLSGGTYWFGITDYVSQLTSSQMLDNALWTSLLIVWSTLLLAGGFCIIRDSFWTGEIKVFKTFFRGIKESALTMLPFMIILAGLYLGVTWILSIIVALIPNWLYIIAEIALYGIVVLVAIYVMTVFSTHGAYKQKLAVTLADAWELYKVSFTANLFNFILSFAPIVIMLMIGIGNSTNFFATLLIAAFIIIGFFYTIFVWETHMMKTFRLYHPVEKKVIKKKAH